MGLYRAVFYGSSMRIPKGFLWRFYIDFYRPNKSHLPFKDPGYFGNVYRAPPYGFALGLFEDRCKVSKGIDWIPKDSYKDLSWNSLGFP